MRAVSRARSVTGAAFDVEDRASVASAAYEPLALSRVAQAKRAATDGARRHSATADGARDRLFAQEGVLDLGKLGRRELGGFGHRYSLPKFGVYRHLGGKRPACGGTVCPGPGSRCHGPIDQPPVKRRFGAMRGQFKVPASFFEPLAFRSDWKLSRLSCRTGRRSGVARTRRAPA